MSLGSPIVGMPEARDFVESPYHTLLNPFSHTLVTETGGSDAVNITTHNWTQSSESSV